jgi:hypothetical protein
MIPRSEDTQIVQKRDPCSQSAVNSSMNTTHARKVPQIALKLKPTLVNYNNEKQKVEPAHELGVSTIDYAWFAPHCSKRGLCQKSPVGEQCEIEVVC